MDQGGEFEKEWILMLENFGIFSTTTGSHAGWQHAFAVRHGGILGMTWHALVVEFNAVSREDMAVTLAAAIDAKNELVTRRGYSPNMLVFGKHISYPEMLGEDEYEPVTQAQSLDMDASMLQRSKCRHVARQVMLREDVQQKLRRAVQRKPATQDREYLPGEVVYFYAPHPTKARYRKDHGRWRGPAVVLLRESPQRYFVSWRGRCLLLAAPNMRLASLEEVGSQTVITEEMQKMLDESQDQDRWDTKEFEDLSQLTPPSLPPRLSKRPLSAAGDEQEAKKMMAGLRSMKKLMQKSSWLREKRHLGIEDGRAQRKPKKLKALEDGSLGKSSGPLHELPPDAKVDADEVEEFERMSEGSFPYSPDAPTVAPEAPRDDKSDEEFWREVGEAEDRYVDEDQQRHLQMEEARKEMLKQFQNQTPQERREQLLDDFPRAALEKSGSIADEKALVLEKMSRDFFATVMVATSQKELHEIKARILRFNMPMNGQAVKNLRVFAKF